MVKVSNVRGAGQNEEAEAVQPNPQKVTFTDSTGRRVTIRQFRGARRMRFFDMLGESASNASYMGIAVLAACLENVDGEEIQFPRSKPQVEALVERFDDGLLEEVGAQYQEHFRQKTEDEFKEAAKNL